MPAKRTSFVANSFSLLKQTFSEWVQDKAPQLGAALAYYTVFSLAPLILVLLAVVGLLFHNDPGAWNKLTEQMSAFLDKGAVEMVRNIAQKASQQSKGTLATVIGLLLALFGASGVFGQLQDALNTVWGVKAKPGGGIWGFLRARFLSFAMVGGICFLLLVSLTLESMLKRLQPLGAVSHARRHRCCLGCLLDLRSGGGDSALRNHFQISARRRNPVAGRVDRRGPHRNPVCNRQVGTGSVSRQR